jgi:hypothetical protein
VRYRRALIWLRHPDEARRREALPLLDQADDTARVLAMTRLSRLIARTRETLGTHPQRVTPLSRADSIHESVDADSEARRTVHRIWRDGPLWVEEFRGRQLRLPDSKGLHSLARMLAEPEREFHVLDLMGAAERPPPRSQIKPDFEAGLETDWERRGHLPVRPAG